MTCPSTCLCRHGYWLNDSTGEWWTVEALPYVGEPWLFWYRIFAEATP